MLLIAAALKGADAITNPLAGGPLLGTRWELLVDLEAEILLGFALLLGLYPTAIRRLTIGCFALFAGINLQQSLAGVTSCGCFGRVAVPPTYTLAIDLGLLVVLGKWRPTPTTHRPASKVIGLVLGGLALLAIGAGTSATTTPGDLDNPGGLAVLDPSEWIGQPFPLLDRLGEDAPLRNGEWILLFHRRGCPACAAGLDEIGLLTQKHSGRDESLQLACLEVPSLGQTGSGELPRCKQLHLRARRAWVTKAPLWVRLSSGRTEAVTVDKAEVRRWFSR